MVKHVFTVLFVVTGIVVASQDAIAQITHNQQPPQTVNLSGPRIGMTMLSPGVIETLKTDHDVEVGSLISQFGWQKEKRFLSSPTGFTGVTEFVFLVGGMEQGVFLPSLNWLVGARTAQGIEFAAGPNVTPAGVGLVIAGGLTFQTGNLNIPVNVAVVPSKQGARMSFLIGFNGRH
jgi:hypothetical protein